MKFLEYKDAEKFVKGLNLKSKSDWRRYCKINKPENIPTSPEIVYKNEWVNWNQWLGNNNKFHGNKNYLIFKEALKITTALNLKSKKEWENYVKQNNINNLPLKPDYYYSEWINWSYWLTGYEKNTKIKSDRIFLNIDDIKKLLKEYKINTKNKYFKFYNNNKYNFSIPSSPISYYNLSSWNILFNKTDNKNYLIYEDAKNIVHSMNIKSQKEWYILCKKNKIPANIPKTPNKFYKNWISWNDWLNHNVTPYKKFISYNDAKNYLKNIGLTSLQEYHDYLICNNINFLPLNPITFYGTEYKSCDDFLNYNIKNKSYGEYKIKKYLDINNIDYMREYRFDNCKNINKLPFDFYLPKHNICIEFDGRQHFECVKWFGGEKGLKNRKINDNIKNMFCYNNNIKLIRISYEDINIIDEILRTNI